MRRKDRELTETAAWKILENGEYGVLSLVDSEGKPYAVPVNYALDDKKILIHCSSAGGEKIDAINHNASVCFTVVSGTEILSDKFSTIYHSAIARGNVELVTDKDAKKSALMLLVKKYSPAYFEKGKAYTDAAVDKVYILKIRVDNLTGKARKK